jgi:cold shock CspA family protein
MKGIVGNLLAAKQFGFIDAENGQTYFFHREDLNGNWDYLCKDWNDPLIKVINVSFEPKSTPKGPRAANVNLIQNS